jgi:hypothetical protein
MRKGKWQLQLPRRFWRTFGHKGRRRQLHTCKLGSSCGVSGVLWIHFPAYMPVFLTPSTSGFKLRYATGASMHQRLGLLQLHFFRPDPPVFAPTNPPIFSNPPNINSYTSPPVFLPTNSPTFSPSSDGGDDSNFFDTLLDYTFGLFDGN